MAPINNIYRRRDSPCCPWHDQHHLLTPATEDVQGILPDTYFLCHARLPQRPAHARRQSVVLALPSNTQQHISLKRPCTSRTTTRTLCDTHASRATPTTLPLQRNALALSTTTPRLPASLNVLLLHCHTHFLRRPNALSNNAYPTHTTARRAHTPRHCGHYCGAHGPTCKRLLATALPVPVNFPCPPNTCNARPETLSASFLTNQAHTFSDAT